jgi:hypothetical protein
MATLKESRENKKSTKKVGQTLLVKVTDKRNFDESVLNNFENMKTKFKSERTNSYFLEFNDSDSAKNAFNKLESNKNCKVKFALYKLFFKFDSVFNNNESEVVKSLVVNTGKELPDLDNLMRKVKLNNNSYYLTFDSKKSALSALKIFEESKTDAVSPLDYNYIKEEHSRQIEEKTGRRPMYYKLYVRKETKELLGCGELTLGNKTSFDILLSSEENGLKDIELGLSGIKGRHYRFNNQKKSSSENVNFN